MGSFEARPKATGNTDDSGMPDNGRELTDKILDAFNFAYAAGEVEAAVILRKALMSAAHCAPNAKKNHDPDSAYDRGRFQILDRSHR